MLKKAMIKPARSNSTSIKKQTPAGSPDCCIVNSSPLVGLPNDPIFTHLARNTNKIIIRDPLQNLEADHVRFLRDILQFRWKISSAISSVMESTADAGQVQLKKRVAQIRLISRC